MLVVKKHPPAQGTHRSRFRWINSFALGRRLFVSLFQTTFFLLSPKNHNCSFGAKWYVLSISRHHSACIENYFLHYFSTTHLCVLALLLSVQVASRQGNAHRTKERLPNQVLLCHSPFQASVGLLISFHIRGKLHSVDQYLNFKLTGLLVFNFYNRMCL